MMKTALVSSVWPPWLSPAPRWTSPPSHQSNRLSSDNTRPLQLPTNLTLLLMSQDLLSTRHRSTLFSDFRELIQVSRPLMLLLLWSDNRRQSWLLWLAGDETRSYLDSN